MIGVVANERDLELADELFQLFKTPWQPARPSRRYRIVVATEPPAADLDADVVVLYGARKLEHDERYGVSATHVAGPVDVTCANARFPLYRGVARFDVDRASGLRYQGQAIEYHRRSGSRAVRRIGYDLFEEVRYLLSEGQPAAHALTPTLELHVDTLRRVLTECGVAFAEVLPRPAAYDFIACLTHDVDFYGIRRHRFDRTLAGFVARASIGTAVGLVRRRRVLADAVRNWTALVRLPFVLGGLASDFWRPFDDYARADGRRRSTFFLLPFKDRPGVSPDGSIDARRAAPYQASDIRTEAKEAEAQGAELAVHGIDAWRDGEAARSELHALGANGSRRVGVRMHWLYFDPTSPQHLETAGFGYDSTWGYNDAIGYRAGTSQVFQFLGTRLLELPMSIMDSALFYPARMNLGDDAAAAMCRQLIVNARRFGGTVVLNWHDRSLAPERLWGAFYRRLLDDIEQGNRVWFATAGQAVDWFRWRRTIRFDTAPNGENVVIEAPDRSGAAGVVRVYRRDTTGYRTEEIPFDGSEPITAHL
jgi:hypothetical protein